MKVFRTIRELREELNSCKQSQSNVSVGLVPTMGYLHDGHASLMTRARGMSDIVVLSIFVNPIQFGPGEDFETYPRDEERDLALAKSHGVDIVFIPTVQEMYPKQVKTKVVVSELTSQLCGASRPGHFDGVTTVVSKLFNIVKPNRAFFGLKDAQQVAVLQQMVTDLNMDVELITCPIIREADGLALSSRNVYLSQEDRTQALVLSRSLNEVREAIDCGRAATAAEARLMLNEIIRSAPLAVIDYAEVLSFPELSRVEDETVLVDMQGEVIMALAVKFGGTRLIDNMLFKPKEALLLV
ncbi:pantoate--beta-alanine ligase [Paenibacillus sp. IHBB 10380]|uniref:pantoate--beta-alanine ligase n=1 Tax=Paenibacillus sp. IHBB 10380 TaxID=1566358 RepID=UPI0005CFDE9A|nr:pantoate--beta-alanine ligase [Paenibacillus sp. IHBB 10380]AJS58072.1 pantoate--beta-alanine ligase [Paenibacillus sp. IHBB 10380]